jgi:hypothetical protein
MITDNITEISIDSYGRLCIKPETEKFYQIWRTATEVHWDVNGLFLYGPKPIPVKEWTYFDWYKHIITVVKNCQCKLIITPNTTWKDIPPNLQQQIVAYKP